MVKIQNFGRFLTNLKFAVILRAYCLSYGKKWKLQFCSKSNYFFNSTCSQAIDWFWKNHTLREMLWLLFLFFKGLKLKMENGILTSLCLWIRNFHAKNYDNRSMGLAVIERQTYTQRKCWTLNLKLRPIL